MYRIEEINDTPIVFVNDKAIGRFVGGVLYPSVEGFPIVITLMEFLLEYYRDNTYME